MDHGFFRASRCTRPVQARKLNSSQRDDHINASTSRNFIFSAHCPEYVSIRQRRYSLRQGRSREPRVAFHKKRSEANKVVDPCFEYKSQSHTGFAGLQNQVFR